MVSQVSCMPAPSTRCSWTMLLMLLVRLGRLRTANRFLLAGAPVPYTQGTDDQLSNPTFGGFHGEWTVETNRFGHYVVFNASERAASLAVDSLRLRASPCSGGTSAIARQRTASSTTGSRGCASRDRTATKLVLVSGVFAPLAPDAPLAATAAPSPTRLEELEAQVERLTDLTVGLREQLEASQRELTLLRQRLLTSADQESKLSVDLERARAHQKSLQAQIGLMSQLPRHAADMKAVLAKQSESEELLELALAENADLVRSLARLRDHADRDEARILTLEATVLGLSSRLEELGEQERERRRTFAARVAPRRGVSGFLDSAFGVFWIPS